MKTLLIKEPNQMYSRYSEGSMLELDNGRIFFAYTRFEDEDDDNAPAEIVACYSDDQGKVWSEEEVVIEREGTANVMSVSLLKLTTGEILFFYVLKNSLNDCKLYVRSSMDNLKTLGPRVCATPHEGYHVINNDRVIQLSSGRILVPTAYHYCLDATYDTWDPHAIALCFYSDDHGNTWHQAEQGLIASYAIPSGFQEPGVVELSDGKVYMWMRTDVGCQFESVSGDGGQTWSEGKPSTIISPLSPASIKRIPWNNELLLVFNDHSGTHPFIKNRRTPLCVALSKNNAKSWSKSKVIDKEPMGWYCYTSIFFLKDRVLLSYCAGDNKVGLLNRLKVISVSKDWLDKI